MDIRDFTPNIRIYKKGELVFQIWPDKGNHNYVTFKVHTDQALAHIIQKYVTLKEDDDKFYEILYARVRGADYDKYKKDGTV